MIKYVSKFPSMARLMELRSMIVAGEHKKDLIDKLDDLVYTMKPKRDRKKK